MDHETHDQWFARLIRARSIADKDPITQTDFRPSNTERGWKGKRSRKGHVVKTHGGWEIREGVDHRDKARGGTLTMKRNRIVVSKIDDKWGTQWANTPKGRRSARTELAMMSGEA